MSNETKLIAFHKPPGFLSQFICDQPKKKLLTHWFSIDSQLMAIGRLDEDSEGLLLLTNNGLLSEYFRQSVVSKVYLAQVDGQIHSQALNQLLEGVSIGLDGEKTVVKAMEVEMMESEPHYPQIIPNRAGKHRPASWISITLNEGKNRQVRKMTAAVGFPTLRLIRVRIGDIFLGDLKPGEYREMDATKYLL